MICSRDEIKKIVEKIRTMSDFPWKHELQYLLDTDEHLREQVVREQADWWDSVELCEALEEETNP